MTTLVRLVAKETDGMDYTTYVFECLEEEIRKETKYIMCTRFPNWDHRNLDLGEVGYLNFEEIQAGSDKWFNGIDFIPYKYSGIHFIKFISKPKKEDYTYIL